jgi:hypothetical protein
MSTIKGEDSRIACRHYWKAVYLNSTVCAFTDRFIAVLDTLKINFV